MKQFLQITDQYLSYQVFSKILESLMYNRLIEFINENGLLYIYQFDFQKGKSTSMALVTSIDKITEALDKGECIIGVFLDFSNAFDTVDHGILLQKLELYGLHDITLKWFKDYLSNRIQYVTYNGIKSMTDIIKCGVSQGSILGPLVFDVYKWFMSSVRILFASLIWWWYKFIHNR